MNTSMPGYPAVTAEEVRSLTAYEIDFVSGGAYGPALPTINLPSINVNIGGVNVGTAVGVALFNSKVNQTQAIGNILLNSGLFAIS